MHAPKAILFLFAIFVNVFSQAPHFADFSVSIPSHLEMQNIIAIIKTTAVTMDIILLLFLPTNKDYSPYSSAEFAFLPNSN